MAAQSQSQSQSSLFFSVSDKSSSSGRRPQDRRKATARKVFCSFCKEEGHMVNDRYGKTACPKLLATECRYCHQKGHILSHCPLLKDKNSRRVAPEQQQEQKQDQKHTSNSRASPTERFSPAFLRIAASEMQIIRMEGEACTRHQKMEEQLRLVQDNIAELKTNKEIKIEEHFF